MGIVIDLNVENVDTKEPKETQSSENIYKVFLKGVLIFGGIGVFVLVFQQMWQADMVGTKVPLHLKSVPLQAVNDIGEYTHKNLAPGYKLVNMHVTDETVHILTRRCRPDEKDEVYVLTKQRTHPSHPLEGMIIKESCHSK